MFRTLRICQARATGSLCVTLFGLCYGMWTGAPAWAVEAESREEDDDVMMVTARKVKEDPRTIPLSVSVFDQQTLSDRRIDTAENLLREVPNVGFSSLGDGRSTYLSLRGVGSMAQPLSYDDTSVVTYIDGVPQPLFASDAGLLDVERVEVLRGPQGTVFGRNAQAGAINVITRQPDDIVEGAVRLEAGLDRRSQNLAQFTVSGPLRDERLKARLTASYANLGPDVANRVPGGKLGKAENGAARGVLTATPNALTQLTLTLHHAHDNLTPSNFVLRSAQHFPVVALDPKGGAQRDFSGLSLSINRQFAQSELTSVTAVNRYDFANLTNNSEALTFSHLFDRPISDFLPATDWSSYDEKQRSLYQEIRVSSRDNASVRWVSGINYLHDDYRLLSDYVSGFFSSTNGMRNNHYRTDSYAAFGEMSAPLAGSERLMGTLGLRYTHDRKAYAARYRVNALTDEGSDAFDQQGVLHYDMVTGRAALNYLLTDNSTLYVSAARGSKSGGFPNFTNNAAHREADSPYQDASVWSYETGSKNRILNGRGEWNLALFYNAVQDENLFAMDALTHSFVPESIDTRSYGVELDGALQLAEHWKLSGGVGYTHATLRHVAPEVTAWSGGRDGNRVPTVPRVTSNLTLQYYAAADGFNAAAARFGLPAANLFALIQHQYVGQREADVGNHFSLDAYHLFNLKLGLEFASADLYLFGQNLTDERPQYIGLWYGPGSEVVSVGHGRVIGAGMQVRW